LVFPKQLHLPTIFLYTQTRTNIARIISIGKIDVQSEIILPSNGMETITNAMPKYGL